MPFCPSCKYEYRQGIKLCPDCDVDLVDKLDEEPQDAVDSGVMDDPLVPVYACEHRMEIDLVNGILEGAGIPAYSRPRYIGRAPDVVYSPFVDNQIYVLACHAEQARELLESFRK